MFGVKYSRQPLVLRHVDSVLEESDKILKEMAELRANRKSSVEIFLQGATAGWSVTWGILSIVQITKSFWDSRTISLPKEPGASLLMPRLENSEASNRKLPLIESTTEKEEGGSSSAVVDTVPKESQELRIIPLVTEVKVDPPSFETLKNGVKGAFMEARHEMKLDGSKGESKVHLNDIAASGREQILLNAGAVHPDDVNINYGKTADLAQSKIEAFIKQVAPEVNAREVAEVALLESGGAVRSNVCVKHAAEAALENIQKQSQGFHASINREGNVAYNSNARQVFVQPGQVSYDHDQSRETANPYSPMGVPSESQPSSLGSGDGPEFVKIDERNLWTQDVSGFLRDTNTKVYGSITVDFPGLKAEIGFQSDADVVFDKGVRAVQNLPPITIPDIATILPSDVPNIDYTGPIYPDLQNSDRIPHRSEFVPPLGLDCDGPVFPHARQSD